MTDEPTKKQIKRAEKTLCPPCDKECIKDNTTGYEGINIMCPLYSVNWKKMELGSLKL